MQIVLQVHINHLRLHVVVNILFNFSFTIIFKIVQVHAQLVIQMLHLVQAVKAQYLSFTIILAFLPVHLVPMNLLRIHVKVSYFLTTF